MNDNDSVRQAWGGPGGGRLRSVSNGVDWLPPVDIVETPSTFEVTLEICGVPREQIDVRAEENRLTVSGERAGEVEGEACHYRERRVGRFARSFAFRVPTDSEGIRAALADGVLTLTVPKTMPTRISVELDQ